MRKPGAFANYRYREDLFPSSRFRMAYDELRERTPARASREYLEILYWLDQTGYEGYLSLDQYPYREEPEKAIAESIQWLRIFRGMLNRIGAERVAGVLRTGDATEASRMLREAIAGNMTGLEE